MDEKMFELMSKLYAEMQEGFVRLDQKIENLDNKLNTGIDGIKQDFVRLENKMDDNHKALYDGYVQNADSMSFSKKVD